MTTPRKILAAGASLTLVAIAAGTIVWGDSSGTRQKKASPLTNAIKSTGDAGVAPEGITADRFARTPVLTYETLKGETHFAMQVQPKLAAAAPRPRDVAIMIDTSASQVGGPMRHAREIAAELIKTARAGDRVAIWTVNTPDATKSLTAGFQDAKDSRLATALDFLKTKEYAAGATDLKGGIRKVLNSFSDSGRQQVILFLGDGESTYSPLTDSDRSAMAADMVSREIAFFPVPLGARLDPKTLHGLASGTGGAVVRMFGEEKVEKFLPKLTAAFDTPIFYPSTKSVKFDSAIIEAMPNRLPPLRSDAPTLVVGLMKAAETIGLTAEGTVAGKPTTVTINEKVPAADAANYFLVSVVHQWRNADHSAPALVRGDRGLALAFEQTRLAREETLTQAHWALSQNQLDAAQKLFEAAGKIDPRDPEPQTGLKVVAKLKDGKITREQIRHQLDDSKVAMKFNGEGSGTRIDLEALNNQDQNSTPPASPADLLELEKRRRAVQEQQVTQIVDDTIKRARALIASDPDGAYDLLKRQLGSVRENSDLSDRLRAQLGGRLEAALRNAVAEGTLVKQRQEAELQRRLADQARAAADAAKQTDEERIRERVRSFGALMNQARYEEAYKEALVLIQEQQSKGKPVPVQATAAYQMSLNAANLREFEELRRIKEDRILLTMLQVEKSHVPFPDEPPVEFPPAATWRTLTALRKDKYDAVGLEGPAARNALRIRDKLLQPASIEKPIEGLPLKDVLDFLSEKYELTFIVDLQAFDRIGKKTVEDEQVRLPKMPGVALGTILRFILSQVNGSLIIRRDYVEITTVDQTILEKAVRAYPVADLVIPIPNGVNQQVLNQNLQILGGSLSANGQAIFGAAGGGQALGFNGALGALGVLGPLGALGAAGAGLGGAAGIGGGAAGAGATGAGFQGALGFAGGNNQTNLGFGGGTLGFGGGQQGQFGNLGGQFGIQGGDTSAILIELIQDVIAPKEWQKRAALYLLNNVNTQVEENEQPILNPDQLNSLGYYQPARALVVRATSRIQTRIGGAINGVRPGGNAQGNKKDNGDVLVINPGDRNNRGNQNPDLLAKAKAETKPVDPAPKPFVMGNLKPRDLQDAVEKGLLKPRQVIAVADVLAIGEKFEEAASFLKANLRQGILVDPCVFNALALALQTSGAAPEEIERVRMSQIDMEPKNPQAYLSAAKGMHELGRHEQAVALCKRAAAIEPNAADAYADSLAYLVKAKDVDTDAVEWATGNLLRRDWAIDQSPLQAQAQQAIQAVIAKLKASGRTSEAQRLEAAVHGQAQRDLVIELLWSDPADLDLEVTEPTGAICSPTIPQSTGGGIWHGDQVLAQDRTKAYQESYIAAEAFTGSYEIRVRTVWGKPMGGKATIRVTRHQGTPNQSQELQRIEFGADGIANLKVRLDDGRRTEITSVPPPAARRVVATTGTSPDRVFNLLRSMSEPAFNASAKTPIAGGTSASGAMTTQAMDFTPDIGPEIIHQNKLLNTTNTGTELQGSATVSSDRKSIRWSLSPVFQTASSQPEINLTTIPGGK